MLSQLYIRNIAVIQEATIELAQGLNVFTGETGAGKTILINAINAVLGERTSRELIRTGEEKAEVSALFTAIGPVEQEIFAQAGYACDDGCALVSREITADGRSTCRINGRPATASILKLLTGGLINIHGQHDNQQLLSPQRHLSFIDGYGELEELRRQYAAAYHTWQAVKRELEALSTDEAEKARRMDLLTYQINEIDGAQLTPGEEEELKAQRRLVKNALNVTQALGGSLELLNGDGESEGLSSLMSMLVDNLQEAAKYLEGAQPVCDKLTELTYELEGAGEDIRELLENLDCDPSQLGYLEDRLALIHSLERKYGPDIPAVLAFREKAAQELSQIETSDERAQQLAQQQAQLLENAQTLAQELSRRRLAAANAFIQAVQEELAFLDMPAVRLSVRREEKPLAPDGADSLELFLAANPGEEPRSLSKVASGGELARLMLSIKNVLADRDNIGTLIFDEVDTGVSGRAAQKIGKKLRQVAQNRQVIVVTHLAQVACYGQHHLLILKEAREGRTYTAIRPLAGEERVQELARIIGGETVSPLALEHAREMLAQAAQ